MQHQPFQADLETKLNRRLIVLVEGAIPPRWNDRSFVFLFLILPLPFVSSSHALVNVEKEHPPPSGLLVVQSKVSLKENGRLGKPHNEIREDKLLSTTLWRDIFFFLCTRRGRALIAIEGTEIVS